ncbi:MAG: MaoC family dehydratase [Actinomycetota bacterium]|nr:MaoC family dehydratase [Actinomycetota bacterium]
MTLEINGIDDLKRYIGKHLGYSEWHKVTQAQINQFADATEDHQWIHVDPDAAKAGPFGTTIAHGYLLLSLIPKLLPEILVVNQVGVALNYGANRIRFPAPVPANSNIRLGATITEVEEFQGGIQLTVETTIESENSSKPSLVAQLLYRYYI